MQTRWREKTAEEINLAPLLDIIFCLLFFFILATSIKEERKVLEVELPYSAQESEVVNENKPLEISIGKDNKIMFEGKILSAAELSDALRIKKQRNTNKPDEQKVIIRSDSKAQVQTFVEVTDACAKAGWKVAMMETQPIESSTP